MVPVASLRRGHVTIGEFHGESAEQKIQISITNPYQSLRPHAACNLYADDTLIYCTGNSIVELNNTMQKCVDDIQEWYEQNKLVINRSKSNVMLVTTRQMFYHMVAKELNVLIDNQKLLQCTSMTYLGVEIDNTLSWDAQTNDVCKKLVFIIYRLSRLKMVLPRYLLMSIYTSIIQPIIDYAISIWGYTSSHNLNKIQRLQNRSAIIITRNYDYVNTRGIDIVKNLKWMSVSQRRDYFMSILMFKSIHGLAPDYMCDEINMQCDIAERSTRSLNFNNAVVPYVSLESFRNAFAYRGPVLWNALPLSTKKCETLAS